MIDLRRVRVGIEVKGRVNFYEGLNIAVSGTKFTSPTQNEATIDIIGLNADTRDYILSVTSPYSEESGTKRVIVEVGRVSTGLFVIYSGDIISAEISSPPDIKLTIKAKTNNANNYKIVTHSGNALQRLSEIARIVANNNGVGLTFEATNKNISNYSYGGAASRQVSDLQRAGNVKAFIDDGMLFVKDSSRALNQRRRILSAKSGMVGIPTATEKGLKVTYLVDGDSDLGGQLTIDSKMNKSLNGDYVIDQLTFDVTTHDDAFFYTAICSRL